MVSSVWVNRKNLGNPSFDDLISGTPLYQLLHRKFILDDLKSSPAPRSVYEIAQIRSFELHEKKELYTIQSNLSS